MHFHYKTTGPDANAFHHALGAIGLIAPRNDANQIGLAMPQLAVLDGVIREVLGEDVVRGLKVSLHTANLDYEDQAQYEPVVITSRIRP